MRPYRLLLFVCMVLALSSCTTLIKKSYKSFNDYPVPSGDLTEMEYSSTKSTFSFWSPNADEVRLMLFRTGDSGHAYRTVHLEPSLTGGGMWTVDVEGNLLGQYYTFNVKIKDKWHGDTPGLNAHAVSANGRRAAIIDLTQAEPAGWGGTCFLLVLAGCSTTRNLPEGEVLYTGQKKMVVRNEAKDRAGAETMTELTAAL